MAAFDLNSLYFLKNAAPRTSSFEEVARPIGEGFELGRAYGENYRQNSLRNLIEQREKEGIPYDRLSNEAAKYDIGTANAMRNERRSSLDYNYRQGVAEFEQWRKNMARRICGLILQKGEELNIPDDDFEKMLEVAAGYVATYDEALAQWLIGQAQTRRYNRARLNKPVARPNVKDDHVKMSDQKQKFLEFSKGVEGTKDQRDLAAAEYDRLQKLEDYIGGRYPMYTWMTGYMRGFRRAGGTYDDAIAEIVKNYNPEERPGFEYSSLRRFPELENDPKIDELNAAIGSNNANAKSKIDKNYTGNKKASTNNVNTENNGELDYSYVKRGSNALGRYTYPIENAHKKMGSDINSADSVEKVERIIAAMEEYESVPGAKPLEALKQRAAKKIEELKVMEDEVGNSSAARLFWKNLPARSRMADAKRFRQAGTFAAGIISTTPFTVIDNALMVQSPDYVVSETMQKAARLINTGDGVKNFVSALASSGNGLASKLSAQMTAFDVLESLGNSVINTMRPMYNEMMEGKTPEEKKELKKFLKGSYGWPDKLFKAIEDPKGTLGTAEEIKRRSHALSKERTNSYFDESENLKESNSSGSKYSAEDLF